MPNPLTYGFVPDDTGALVPCQVPRREGTTIRRTFHAIAVACDVLQWGFLPVAAFLICTVHN